MRKIVWIMGMFIWIGALIGCTPQTTYEYEAAVKRVSVAEAEQSEKPKIIKATGYVQPNQMMPHVFVNAGILETLDVQTGDFVEVGDVLATSIGPSGVENLVAMIDGYVAEVDLRLENLVSPEQGRIVVVDEVLKVHYGITLNESKLIESSQNVETHIVYHKERIKADAIEVGLFLNPQTQLLNANSDVVYTGKFPIGQKVAVEITLDALEGIWIPLLWLQSDGRDYLNIVDSQGIVQRRYVTWYDLFNEWVRVDGVEPGEKIVVDGVGLQEGQRVVLEEANDEKVD